jgi:phosphate-selective porin OprO/OprP
VRVQVFAKSMIWGLAVCFSHIAIAEETDLLETLLKNKAITEKQYEQLRRQEQLSKQQKSSPQSVGSQDVVVTTKGGLQGRTRDGRFSFLIGGRLMFDGAWYSKDKRELGSGSEVRRARIDLEGHVWNDWGYRFEADFAENEVELKDNYIEYRGFEPLRIRTGHIKESFSLEEQTSSKYITFMERALPNTLVPERSLGINARTYRDTWTFGTGFFGEGADDKNDSDGEIDEGYGISARGTYTPWVKPTQLIHLGASVSYRKTGDDNAVRIRERPESHITSVRFVDTDDIENVDAMLGLGVEAAGVYGPFSLQGEYIRTSLDRDTGAPDLDFDGYYVYGSWLVTGESRSYRHKIGEFGRIKPRGIVGIGGIGAWEVALRYSNLDLTDGNFDGGKEHNITFGVNWYATPNIRAMANYIRVDSEKEGVKDNPDIVQVRAQVDF